MNQQGTGAGVIVAVRPDKTQFQVDAAHPASAADVLVIYCSGLGQVTPSVDTGTGATGITSTVNPVTVTIGAATVPVSFAGSAPGFPGLYQVNVPVPKRAPQRQRRRNPERGGATEPTRNRELEVTASA